jgi:hypothetical protein
MATILASILATRVSQIRWKEQSIQFWTQFWVPFLRWIGELIYRTSNTVWDQNFTLIFYQMTGRLTAIQFLAMMVAKTRYSTCTCTSTSITVTYLHIVNLNWGTERTPSVDAGRWDIVVGWWDTTNVGCPPISHQIPPMNCELFGGIPPKFFDKNGP